MYKLGVLFLLKITQDFINMYFSPIEKLQKNVQIHTNIPSEPPSSYTHSDTCMSELAVLLPIEKQMHYICPDSSLSTEVGSHHN